ncbi:MAG: hypothetical protein DWQ19_10360 [Crenarchaeota archaeon]|nr:MAG: hypothetical protein DWQ19_10360 [Thermoproteota archaeon]
MSNLKEKIWEALENEEIRYGYLNVRSLDKGFEFEYGAMYSAPAVGFSNLMRLSELFGTEKIDLAAITDIPFKFTTRQKMLRK